MLTLPEKWPDETIYSLFAKIVRLNGLDHLRGTGILAGAERPKSVIGCPVNIKCFCEATQGAYGSPRDLLHDATVLPALAHLGELCTSTLLRIEDGTLRPELGLLVFGMTRRRPWRICRECLKSDVRTYGIGYWHRAHQLPASQYCMEHGLGLERPNLRRTDLLDLLVLPSDEASEARRAIGASAPNNLAFDVSMLARDALADKSESFSKDVILATYRAELAQMGLLTDTGRVRLVEYCNDFRRKFCVNISTREWLRQSKLSNPSSLLHGITDELDPRPFARLLLTRFLFGTWGAFKEKCRWQDMLGGTITGESTELPSFEVMLHKQRQVCLDYKNSRMSPTRDEFIKVSYRAFRWLRNNDRTWLDHELPVRKTTKGQGTLFE